MPFFFVYRFCLFLSFLPVDQLVQLQLHYACVLYYYLAKSLRSVNGASKQNNSSNNDVRGLKCQSASLSTIIIGAVRRLAFRLACHCSTALPGDNNTENCTVFKPSDTCGVVECEKKKKRKNAPFFDHFSFYSSLLLLGYPHT